MEELNLYIEDHSDISNVVEGGDFITFDTDNADHLFWLTAHGYRYTYQDDDRSGNYFVRIITNIVL
jgi:hypothetical protein